MKQALLFSLLTLFLPAFARDAPLTLQQAWRTALEQSPTEQAALARLDQARARYGQAVSQYHPRIGLRASGSRLEYSDTALERIPGVPDSVEQYETGLEANWLLWDNGTRKNRVEASRLGREASAAELGDTRETLLAEVGRAFTSAQLARANLRIAESDREFQARQLENSRRKEEAGLDSRADRLNFEIRMVQAENAAVRQGARYEASMAALKALLGRPPESELPPPAELGDMEDAPPPPELESLWKRIPSTLPALRRAEFQVEAARATVKALKGEYGPDLSLFGGLNAEREDGPNFSGSDVGGTVGLQLSWDLWDGHLRKEQVNEATAALRETEAAARRIRLRARAGLRGALVDYQASLESETLSARSRELSLENRELVEASYEAGRETLLRLNEAQRDYNNAVSRYAAARLARRLAWIDLQRAAGILMEMVEEESTTSRR